MPALVRSLTSARISFIEVFRRNSEFSSPVALGHSSVTNFTERHYAKWNKAQQDLLDNDLSGAWGKIRAMLEAKRILAKARTDKDKTYYENRCAALDRQIDRLVYELYELTEDEIQIVERRT